MTTLGEEYSMIAGQDLQSTFPVHGAGLIADIVWAACPTSPKGIDIRLEEIVMSKPEKMSDSVAQYDQGKAGDRRGRETVCLPKGREKSLSYER